jgi:hypothetical protein
VSSSEHLATKTVLKVIYAKTQEQLAALPISKETKNYRLKVQSSRFDLIQLYSLFVRSVA